MMKSNGSEKGARKAPDMLASRLKRADNSNMQRLPEISKAAFLARFNDRACRVAVDCHYEFIGDRWRLVIEFDTGERELFAGFNKAA